MVSNNRINVILKQHYLSIVECPSSIHYGLLWEPVAGNTTVYIPCSSIHTSFRKRLDITRKCSINGTWMAADLSSCAVDPDFASLMILSFLCPASVVDVAIKMKVILGVCKFSNIYFALLGRRNVKEIKFII